MDAPLMQWLMPGHAPLPRLYSFNATPRSHFMWLLWLPHSPHESTYLPMMPSTIAHETRKFTAIRTHAPQSRKCVSQGGAGCRGRRQERDGAEEDRTLDADGQHALVRMDRTHMDRTFPRGWSAR